MLVIHYARRDIASLFVALDCEFRADVALVLISNFRVERCHLVLLFVLLEHQHLPGCFFSFYSW